MMKKLSIVVPVFNEQENIHEFYRRVTEVMAPLSYDYELLFIDDGSRDQSAAMIRELADKDPHVEGYLFSRNYGHQLALTCGLEHAKGDAVISMDGDLQHPPEMIPELISFGNRGMRSCRPSVKRRKTPLSSKISRQVFIISSSIP